MKCVMLCWSGRVTLLLAFITLFSQAEGCSSGWFGPSLCEFKCHCTGFDCDEIGNCLQGSKCVKGWFGPACQYVDFTTTEHKSPTPIWLADGDDRSCNPDPKVEEATVTLTMPFPFTWLRVYVEDSANLHNITVQLNSGITCSNMKTAKVDDNTLDIHCDAKVTVNRVTLTGKGVASLCSVYISGGRNVALRQRASQTSDWVPTMPAENGVDGDTRAICTHTSDLGTDKAPTWTLYFTQPQMINRYVIYNREDKYRERLNYFTLKSYDQGFKTVYNYQDPWGTAILKYVLTSASQTSPIWRVAIQVTYVYPEDINKGPILTLCEVETYGETICASGRYGRQCEHYCNCAVSTEACLVSTGGCPSGCAAGYYGESCDISCPPTTYGVSCEQACSSDCVDQLCDRITGVCDECRAGRTGDFCDQDCPSGRFGMNCSELCSQNCGGDGGCDPEHGTCVDGCKDGFSGSFCNNDCPTGTFGNNCADQCSQNCGGDGSCHQEDGTCTDGCKDGFTGPLCSNTCPPTTHGSNCEQECSTFCVDQLCDSITGICDECGAGSKGDYCDQDCPSGTFGKNCGEECSQNCGGDGSCHPENGTCTDGCKNGFIGPLCSDTEASPEDESFFPGLAVGLGVGISLSVILVIAGVVIGVCCYRRRSRAGLSDSPPSYRDALKAIMDNRVYQRRNKAGDRIELPDMNVPQRQKPTHYNQPRIDRSKVDESHPEVLNKGHENRAVRKRERPEHCDQPRVHRPRVDERHSNVSNKGHEYGSDLPDNDRQEIMKVVPGSKKQKFKWAKVDRSEMEEDTPPRDPEVSSHGYENCCDPPDDVIQDIVNVIYERREATC